MKTHAIAPAPEDQRYRTALESELSELTGISRQPDALRVERDSDPVDWIEALEETEIVFSRLDAETHLRHDVEAALEKIGTANYGVCEQCGQPIPRERLNAVPWARFCVSCQAQAEGARAEYPTDAPIDAAPPNQPGT